MKQCEFCGKPIPRSKTICDECNESSPPFIGTDEWSAGEEQFS